MPVESPADRHGQWMPHLARMNKRHWTVGDTVDSGEQWGEALSRCRQWGIHEARSKNGGHRSKVASGVTLRHKRWVTGTWVVRRAHSGRQRRTQQAGMVSEATLRAVSGAMVRQADNRDHAGTGMLSSQWHSHQWVTGTGGSGEPRSGRAVTGATQGQTFRELTHSLAERSVRGTLGQAWSVGATQVVGSVESHAGCSAGGQRSQRPHLSQ